VDLIVSHTTPSLWWTRTERRIRFTQIEQYAFIFFEGHCNIIRLITPISQGTPAFISAQLLKSYMGDHPPATRTFIHDVESLLWVLVWVVAHRSQNSDSWEINTDAQELIQNLSQNSMRRLGTYKADLLDGGLLGRTVDRCGNDFSKALAPVVGELADLFRIYFYNLHNEPSFKFLVGKAKGRALEDKNEHELLMSESREATFDRLFAILDAHIEGLKHHPIDLTKL
jgi:hypothetical protein